MPDARREGVAMLEALKRLGVFGLESMFGGRAEGAKWGLVNPRV